MSLARSLGLRLVAEKGVETRSDWEYLRRLEVEVAQGFAISRPLCPQHFAAWLSDWWCRPEDLPVLTELFRAAASWQTPAAAAAVPTTSPWSGLCEQRLSVCGDALKGMGFYRPTVAVCRSGDTGAWPLSVTY